MKILAVDTSSSVCSVAILEDDKVIKENILDNGKTHSENFMPLLDKTLKDVNLTLDDIDLIACCIGPGSFTGIRIGIASIKAIAEVKNLPIVSVTSLESLAYNEDSLGAIISMIDARNNQVYAGIFNNKHEKNADYIADSIDNTIEVIRKYIENNAIRDITFVGDGSTSNKEILEKAFSGVNIVFSDNNKQKGTSLGICAYNKFTKKEDIKNADTLNPLYLRKSQAERMKNAGK